MSRRSTPTVASTETVSAAQQKSKVHYPLTPLLLIFFAIGVGEMASFLNLYYNMAMPLAVAYSAAILGAIGGMSLSLFVIYLLRGAKLQSGALLKTLKESGGARLADKAEEEVGSSRTLALSGQALSGTAIAATLAMAVTSIAHIKTGEDRFLPMPWLAAQSTLSSFANLVGFVLSTLAGVRNAELLSRKHQRELGEKDEIIAKNRRYINQLKKQLTDAGIDPIEEGPVAKAAVVNPVASTAELSSPITTSAAPVDVGGGAGLFSTTASDVRRRSSAVGADQGPEIELASAVATSSLK